MTGRYSWDVARWRWWSTRGVAALECLDDDHGGAAAGTVVDIIRLGIMRSVTCRDERGDKERGYRRHQHGPGTRQVLDP